MVQGFFHQQYAQANRGKIDFKLRSLMRVWRFHHLFMLLSVSLLIWCGSLSVQWGPRFLSNFWSLHQDFLFLANVDKEKRVALSEIHHMPCGNMLPKQVDCYFSTVNSLMVPHLRCLSWTVHTDSKIILSEAMTLRLVTVKSRSRYSFVVKT